MPDAVRAGVAGVGALGRHHARVTQLIDLLPRGAHGAQAVRQIEEHHARERRALARLDDQPFDAVLREGLASEAVAESQPGFQVRGAARLEPVDGPPDGPAVVGGGRREHDPGVIAEGDDGDGVRAIEAVDEPVQGVLDRLETRFALHRA